MAGPVSCTRSALTQLAVHQGEYPGLACLLWLAVGLTPQLACSAMLLQEPDPSNASLGCPDESQHAYDLRSAPVCPCREAYSRCVMEPVDRQLGMQVLLRRTDGRHQGGLSLGSLPGYRAILQVHSAVSLAPAHKLQG